MEWINLILIAAAFFFLGKRHGDEIQTLEIKLRGLEIKTLRALEDDDDLHKGYNKILQKHDSRLATLERKR